MNDRDINIDKIENFLKNANSRDQFARFICKAYLCDDVSVEIIYDYINELGWNERKNRFSKKEREQLYDILKKEFSDSDFISIYLDILPSDTSTAFTNTINKYLKKQDIIDDEIFLYFMENDLDELVRFKSFYTLFTYHHDKSDSSFCRKIVDNSQEMKKFPLWNYAYSVILKDNNNESDMQMALTFANKCIEIYVENSNYDENYPGIYHNYAELVYFSYDKKYSTIINDDICYENAIKYIDKSITINHIYAKYYYTKARLLSVKGRYQEATDLINKAIDIEDSSKKNYSLIINEYKTTLLSCKINQKLDLIDKKIKELDITISEMKSVKEDLNSVKSETQNEMKNLQETSMKISSDLENEKKSVLELLGFFSGIISLIIVTSQVLLGLKTLESIAVLVAFLGVLVISLGVLHIIIANTKKNYMTQSVIIIVIGTLILASSMIYTSLNIV